ncbi:MAG: aldo/keto reductase [Saprospiraceae bacterium]|nr:aldo/keto reductase [Saprospiraceae bacterium]
MEYRKIGNTDLELSVITFGAWAAGGWMWGGNDEMDAIKAIQTSLDLGVTSIDTAPVYGQGASEHIVGKALKGVRRDQVQILTKFGMRWDDTKGSLAFKSKDNTGRDIDIYKYAGPESIVFEVEQSLRRLQTDYIDLYQIHWPDVTTPIEISFEAVAKLIQQGKVRYAGVCNYSAAQMEEAEKVVQLASNQVPYSMVNRGIEAELIPHCIQNKKAILAYSPLERGLLTGKLQSDHQFSPGDHRANHKSFTPDNIKKTNDFLASIEPLARDKGISLAQLVLKWTCDVPGITIALAGARNAKQAAENAAAADVEMNREEFDFIQGKLESFFE